MTRAARYEGLLPNVVGGGAYTPEMIEHAGAKTLHDLRGWDVQSELVLEDVEVPLENRLGEEGEGFVNFMKTLDAGRIGIGALALGLAQGAYETALHFSNERKQFGKVLREFQGIQFKLADMATRIQAARHLVYHAAWLKQNGREFVKEAAMAKLYATDIAMDVTTEGVQLLGGYGYTTDYPVERHMRDAKICQIGEGTNQVQRLVIARRILNEAFAGR